jgi:hypothetical protein
LKETSNDEQKGKFMVCKKVIHLTKESADNHALALETIYSIKPNIYQCSEHSGLCVYHVGYNGHLRSKFNSATARKYEKVHKTTKPKKRARNKENSMVKVKADEKIATTLEGIENIFLKLVKSPIDRVLAKKIENAVEVIAPIIQQNSWQIGLGGTSYPKTISKPNNVRIYLETVGNACHVKTKDEYKANVIKSWQWDRITDANYGTISQDTMYAFLKDIAEVVQSESIKRSLANNPPTMLQDNEDVVDPIEEHLTELLFGLVQIPSTKLRSRIHEVAQEATPLLKRHKLALRFEDKKLYPYRLNLEHESFRTQIKTWNLLHTDGMPIGKVKEAILFIFMENLLAILSIYPAPLKMNENGSKSHSPAKIEQAKDDTPALVKAMMPPDYVSPELSKGVVTMTIPVPKRHIIAVVVPESMDNGVREIKIEFFSEQALKFLKGTQSLYWGQYKSTPPNKVSIFVNPNVWSAEEIANYINSFVPNLDNKENYDNPYHV